MVSREEGIQVRACRQLSSLLPLLTGCGQPQRLLYRIQEPARAVQEQLRYVLFLPGYQVSTTLHLDHAYKQQPLVSVNQSNDLPFPVLLEQVHQTEYVRRIPGLFSSYTGLCLPGSIPVPVRWLWICW